MKAQTFIAGAVLLVSLLCTFLVHAMTEEEYMNKLKADCARESKKIEWCYPSYNFIEMFMTVCTERDILPPNTLTAFVKAMDDERALNNCLNEIGIQY